MRTLDPEIWRKTLRKQRLDLSRPMRFGKRPYVVPEGRARTCLHDAMKEYFMNCSVNGVKYITDRNRPAIARYAYAFLLFLLICFGLFTVTLNTYERSITEPSTVFQREELHSIEDVPFPAVGLCSNNVISRRAISRYVAHLVDARLITNKTNSTSIAMNLAQLGHLASMTLPEDPIDFNFMGYLANVDPGVRVSRLMSRLAPNCSTMLIRCGWKGETLPCQQLFQTKVTPLGYCCVFNSRYQPQDIYKLPKFLDIIGQEYGLSVVVKQDTEDVISFRRLSHDIDVLIFDGSDYPLLEGGGARLYPAAGSASVYVSLKPSLYYPEESFNHDVEKLNCRSSDARGAGSRESQAWCLAECRRESLDALCACRLHTLPPSPRGLHRHSEECSLTHLACMNKHREKLLFYYPRGPVPLEQELQNAQDCTHCVPDCVRVVYSASVAVSQHNVDEHIKDQLLGDLPPDNVTTIRLYYSSRHIKSFVFQSNSRWYEKFVQLGSSWSLVVGASVVGVSELVFHCSLRWRHRCQSLHHS